ncbi:chemotaxis protein CheB [Marinospirillum sp.]|uniref:chemotaxis protein CheB n=1 Tax=Marinospirillum sp. TaxID=2183934 RepID=UPI00384CACFB
MGSDDFFVVGIGASAGGLEALEQFFKACPETTGAAFVVVQHLSPDHKSIMHDLLARYTRMPIQVVEDGMVLQPNHVYLIPPAVLMRLTDKHLVLSSKDPHHLTLPIDIFFRSLAENRQEKAAGIILSGTGSDGSRGVVSINAEGGLVLVQDPRTAKFDGMPKSALATGVMDAVLPPERLSERLVEHFLTPTVTPQLPAAQSQSSPDSEEVILEKLLQLLADVGQIDFRDYKLATVMRRIQRRMQVKQFVSLQSYYKLLQESPEEVADLRRELLIPVTSFFRDPLAYQKLAELVIPQLVEETASGETLRVWVAGTSTGEEAYSLAILFHEAFEKAQRWPNLKIFATDVNPLVVDFAGQGSYPESCAAELSLARLERFFKQVGSHYVVQPELRQSIVFARHNLLVDPPFTRMHLVSCRNVLIYFKPEAQERALQRLQYATRPGGALFLGSSESSNVIDRGFVTLDSKHKILQRNNQPLAAAPEMTRTQGILPGLQSLRRSTPKPYATQHLHQDQRVIDAATLQLQDHYAPPAMLINEDQEVIHLFGQVQPYFALRPGSVSMLIGRILPESLVPVVSALIYKALKENQVLTSSRLQVLTSQGDQRQLRLKAHPLITQGGQKYLLLCFEEDQHPTEEAGIQPEELNLDSENTQRIASLQQELEASRQSLQATIEELETSNEELQATNEELMASNEELQSSNEELQSVNEELNTVNAEYQEKVGQLNRLNADLESMAKSVGIATVFLDGRLQLTRFSPDAVRLFNLRTSDLGRPLEHLTHQLDYFDLMDDLAFTLQAEEVVEKEVKSKEGRVYLVRLLPYRIASSKDQGVVASFVDITAFHDYKRLQAILDALPQKVAVLEKNGTIALINKAWQQFSEDQEDPQLLLTALGANHLQADHRYQQGRSAEAIEAQQGLQEVLEGQRASFVMKYPCHTATQERWYIMNAAPIYGQHELSAVVSLINISHWNQLEANNSFIET